MTSEHVIYTAADSSYELQARVLLQSLVRTQLHATRLTIFGDGWSVEMVERLERIATNFVSVEVVNVTSEMLSNVQLSNNFPLATTYNVLAPLTHLEGVDLALYMDADCVVRKDLSALFSAPPSTPVAAVVDAHVAMMGVPSMWRPWREEQADPNIAYLNTGVMLVNVASWRSSEITERVLSLLGKYQLPCVDQDALNLVLRGSFDRLEPKYNSMPYHLMKLLRNADLVETDDAIGDAIIDPSIIHFHRSFLGKPWNFGCSHPARHLWSDLASEVSPRWRRKLDVLGIARGVAAKYAKMSTLDERAEQMQGLEIEDANSE